MKASINFKKNYPPVINKLTVNKAHKPMVAPKIPSAAPVTRTIPIPKEVKICRYNVIIFTSTTSLIELTKNYHEPDHIFTYISPARLIINYLMENNLSWPAKGRFPGL